MSDASIREVIVELRSPTVAIMGVMLFLFIFVGQTFSAFYPTYLVDEKGLSPTVAGTLFGLFFAVGGVAKPLAGAAYDRIGIHGSLPLVLDGSIVGPALLPFVNGIAALVGVTALISTMLGSGAITQSYLAELFLMIFRVRDWGSFAQVPQCSEPRDRLSLARSLSAVTSTRDI